MVKRRIAQEHGFTLTELMLAITIGLIVVGMAMGGVSGMIKTARADGGLATLASGLRAAREAAIGNRRNVELSFGTNTITLTRQEYCPAVCTVATASTYPGCTTGGSPATCVAKTTALRTVTLEGRVEFRKPPSAITVDTPDTFGFTAANGINLATTGTFTTDGSFLNSSGDTMNGSIFIGVPNDTLSTRAVSIFGPTGAMRLWKWDGRAWVEQ
jgi:prepilin-type N-terminal cleavage/methylation domain-containing protein